MRVSTMHLKLIAANQSTRARWWGGVAGMVKLRQGTILSCFEEPPSPSWPDRTAGTQQVFFPSGRSRTKRVEVLSHRDSALPPPPSPPPSPAPPSQPLPPSAAPPPLPGAAPLFPRRASTPEKGPLLPPALSHLRKTTARQEFNRSGGENGRERGERDVFQRNK